MLATVDRADRVRHIVLQPFGPADLTEQLRGILGHQPDATLVRTVIERSDGNPFLAEESPTRIPPKGCRPAPTSCCSRASIVSPSRHNASCAPPPWAAGGWPTNWSPRSPTSASPGSPTGYAQRSPTT